MKLMKFMLVSWSVVTTVSMLLMFLEKIEPQLVLIPLVWQFYIHWQIKEKQKEAK